MKLKLYMKIHVMNNFLKPIFHLKKERDHSLDEMFLKQ